MKIIITENQLKRIILEQDPVVERGQALEIKLPPNSFPSGQYRPINTQAIDGALAQINGYISKYPKNTAINVTIESSESKVPNSGVGLKPGDLSRLRAEEVKNYLDKKLPQNVNLIIDNKGAQGPDWDTKKGSKHPDYTAWQYVKLFASVSGEKETPVNTGTTTNNICDFKETMNGGVAYPNNNFLGYSKSIDISKMPVGSKFKIVMYPRMVPDMLVVRSGNKIINTGFVGDEPKTYWNIMLGTILYHTYVKNGQKIPGMFPSNIKNIPDPSSFNDDGGLQELLGHVVNINWSKSGERNVERIKKAGGFWTFTSDVIKTEGRDELFPGRIVGVTNFVKDESMNSVDIFVYSPIGTTIWDIQGGCM
jgi:hypothetical protein